MLPRWIKSILAILAVLSLLPFACIWKARNTLSPEPRIHIIQDMDNPAKFKPQQANPLFADGRADRQPVPGTMARAQLEEDERLYRGIADGQWTATVPIPLTETFLKRGQQRFEIYCSPCHGLSGYGDGPVAKRADRLQEGTWVPPLSFHSDQVRARPVDHLFNTIANGAAVSRGAAPARPGKRDALLSLRGDGPGAGYVPAAFFLHFDARAHFGRAAVRKHVEYFRATGMDFVKVQYERTFPAIPEIRTPGDWKGMPRYGLDFYAPQLEVVEGLVKAVGHEALVLCTLYSPFMCAGHTVGRPVLVKHIEEDGEAVRAGLDAITESLLAFVREARRLGSLRRSPSFL